MKYLFKGITWIMGRTIALMAYIMICAMSIIWHFSFEKLRPFKLFLKEGMGQWDSLGLSIITLIAAVVSAILGFGGVSPEIAPIARIGFFIAVALFAFSLIMVYKPEDS